MRLPSVTTETCFSFNHMNCKVETKQWWKWTMCHIRAHFKQNHSGCQLIFTLTHMHFGAHIRIYVNNKSRDITNSVRYLIVCLALNPSQIHRLLRERYHQFLLYISIDKNININKWLNFIRKVVPKKKWFHSHNTKKNDDTKTNDKRE